MFKKWKKEKEEKKKKKTASSKEEFAHKTISEWSAEEVCLWVGMNGFSQYSPKFLEQDVTGEVLVYINDNDLKSVGLHHDHSRLILADLFLNLS